MAQLAEVLTITLTASVQNPNSTDNGTVTTTPAPVKHSVDTKDILLWLAQDENAETNYGSTTFPSGAKLVTINGNSQDFQVLDKNNNLLVDVSDILSSSNPGNNNIFSGKQNDTNQLAAPTTTSSSLLTITFDDTAIVGGVGVKFFLTGIGTGKTTDTAPNATTGAYTETDSGALSTAAGEGSYQGNPFVCTGTASASGKGTLNITP